jgi:hypothetical protein
MKAQRGCRIIVLAITTSTLKSLWVASATTKPLCPREIDPAPICQVAWWASGPVWTSTDNLAAAGVGTLDLPARSESLRLLSHPGRLYSLRRRFCIAGFEKVLSTLSETMATLRDFSAIVAF